ncbi:MAG TPA: hypothetical protein VFR78_07590 [Pyrinomonadaceae bacterium]|nr:hypothetical protein [Pyrinomonadaceae bacterium]
MDVLLRIASSNRIDKQWKQEILEEAFPLAVNAQNELREKVIPSPGASADTRSNYRSFAFARRVDALSLRVRIIDQMLTLDKDRALRLLEQISPKLSFRAKSCSDQTMYDVADFYRLLEKIIRATFDHKRIEHGERVQFLLPYIENTTSPVQITPVTNLLTSLNLGPKESLIVVQAFTNALKKISADDRSFTASLTNDRTTNSIIKLIQSYRKNQIPTDDVLSAYRLYVSRHLTGPRCGDNVQLTGKELPYYVKEINYFYPDNPFTSDETKPAKVEPGPSPDEYFKSALSHRLLEDFQSLRGYDDDEPINRESTTSPAWQEKMLDYLRKLEAWEGQTEANATDYFNQKCNLYLALINIVPSGDALDQVLLSYIKLLSQEGPLRESRVEWLWHTDELFRFVRRRAAGERSKMLRMIANSKTPALQVYAELVKANLF